MTFRILIAEDDEAISELIAMTLAISHYEPFCYNGGAKAMEAISIFKFDLALLDIMLPHNDGYELLDALKKKNIPAIFITAKTELKDKIHGLRLGAEDYITKPFEPLELLARVDTALRRLKPYSDIISIRNVTINVMSRTVLKDSMEVLLSPLEYDLLELLIKNPNLIFSRDQLLDKIWGFDYFGGTRTVDMHIQKLRSKLDFHDVIRTIHRVGYKLEGGVTFNEQK